MSVFLGEMRIWISGFLEQMPSPVWVGISQPTEGRMRTKALTELVCLLSSSPAAGVIFTHVLPGSLAFILNYTWASSLQVAYQGISWPPGPCELIINHIYGYGFCLSGKS